MPAKQLKRKPKPTRPPAPPCEHQWRYEHSSQDDHETTITERCTLCGLQAFTTQTREIEG